MGRTESVQSLDITEVTLDVVTDFKALMSAAIGIDSVYTVAKASFETLTTDSKMTEVEQANVLANLLGSMTASITNAAMGTALDKAKFEGKKIFEGGNFVQNFQQKIQWLFLFPYFLSCQTINWEVYSFGWIDKNNLFDLIQEGMKDV